MREHEAMLACPCSEPDRLLFLCLGCGAVKFDPSWLILGFAGFFFGLHIYYWIKL